MKYTTTAMLAILATLSTAQDISSIPSCALECISEALASNTKCAPNDFVCVCNDSASLTKSATPCVTDACGADTALKEVQPAVQAFCAAIVANSGGSDEEEEPTSSESTPAPTKSTSVPATTVTPVHSGSGNGNGNATSTFVSPTLTSATVVPTAGAASVVGGLGGFAVVALGALVVL